MSEAKLKSLKVVDLKDILARASVSVPAKANKQDLIARVLANPAALDVYNKQQNPTSAAPVSAAATDDLLAPPEDFDWEGDETGPTDVSSAKDIPSSKQPAPPPARATKPSSKAAAKPAPSTRNPAPAPVLAVTSATEPVADTSAIVDEELEKRKKRAARFGVPLVETPKSRSSPTKRGSNTPRTAATRITVSDEPDKLQARVARFGIIQPVIGKKRSVEEVVDAEELERRKKRAERFGIPSVGNEA